MKISSREDGLLISDLGEFFAGLLREIPSAADPSDSLAARNRLYSKPADDPQLNEEWQEYVLPELQILFRSASQTVRDDLQQLEKSNERGHELTIPKEHFDRWLNALNQARLALASRHDFSAAELSADQNLDFSTLRDLSLFQVHFYGLIQEYLVRETEN